MTFSIWTHLEVVYATRGYHHHEFSLFSSIREVFVIPGYVRVRTLVFASMVGIGLLLTACGGSETLAQSSASTSTPVPTEFSGYVRSPAINVSSVTLPSVDGTPVNMVADPGGLKLVYFGYTSCPDVCPTTLSHVKMALAGQSQAARDRVQVDMITIDPSRDTQERLGKYVANFVPSGNAIRTEDFVLLRSAADAFGADFTSRIDEKGERQVSHTGDLYVVDDTGTVILAWPFGTAEPDIERDLTRLLGGERPPAGPTAESSQGTGVEQR